MQFARMQCVRIANNPTIKSKVSPSGPREPLSRGEALRGLTVLHAYYSHVTPRGSQRFRTMACGGRRCTARRYESGGLDLGFAWVGSAILCANQHESGDMDSRDQHHRNERESDVHREQVADISPVGQQCAAAVGNVGVESQRLFEPGRGLFCLPRRGDEELHEPV